VVNRQRSLTSCKVVKLAPYGATESFLTLKGLLYQEAIKTA